METMVRESWSDGRLDEFEKRIDERFDRVDERFDDVDRRFEQVDRRLDKLAGSLESMQRTMVLGVIALFSAYAAGFAALITQV
ncbi:MAG TPA: hypothetical protein VFN18_01555 [Solirubrobacterales bacterium]|nr:hypothetical protein [Solirubrobacterales bacterium]